jgi:hypothetical protein
VTAQQLEWASDVQAQAFAHGPTPMCMSGGWGSGKTWALCIKALYLSDIYPKNRGVIARRVAKELRATTMATFYKLCPPAAYARGRRNDQDGSVVLNNGSEILFLHLDNPDTEGIMAGLETNWFGIDQAEEGPERMEGIFDKMLGRLGRWDQATVPDWLIAEHVRRTGTAWPWLYPQSDRPMPPPYAMIAVNPDTELHWVYRRFHPDSLEHQKLFKPLGYRMFHMPSTENKYLSDINKQQLLAHDETFVRRYVRGEWGNPEGVIHTVDALSIIDGTLELEDYLRKTCLLYRVLDHGDSAPTVCAWMAVDQQGNVFFYREYYQPNRLISHHRQEITALSEGERYAGNLADPSIFAKMMQKFGGRWSVADEYKDDRELPRETVLSWLPADNNELGTRNRINEYLHIDRDRVHPITNQMGSPRLFFVRANDRYPNGVNRILTELRSQRRLRVGTDLGKPVFSDERDPDVTDHGYDVTRYAIASRPSRASADKPALPGTFQAATKLLKEAHRLRSVR